MREKNIKWEGDKDIKDLISELVQLVQDGYTDVRLEIDEENVDMDTPAGDYEIVNSPKLIAKM